MLVNKILLGVLLAPLAACGTLEGMGTSGDATATRMPTATPIPATATSIPTVEATPDDPESLTLWIPDVLAPSAANAESTGLLNQQIADFAASEEDVTVEVRRKRINNEVGGIMPTLHTARDVAPGALPDLTIMRREDMLQAVQADLIQPMEGVVSSAVIGNLFPATLALGQVDDTLYGLPYAVDILHLAYPSADANIPEPAFAGYLENDLPLVFPAAQANSINEMFLVQYLEAGGSIDDEGELVLDEDALRTTLAFYENALQQGVISSDVLDYAHPSDYRSMITGDAEGAFLVEAGLYLALTRETESLRVAAIPTASGEPATALDGWMWVMTTIDPDRRDIAALFVDWMMDAERQEQYVQSLDLLPSQRTTLRRWQSASYMSFVGTMMENAYLPLADAGDSTVARAIQGALVTVISGERTAQQATQDVINQLES